MKPLFDSSRDAGSSGSTTPHPGLTQGGSKVSIRKLGIGGIAVILLLAFSALLASSALAAAPEEPAAVTVEGQAPSPAFPSTEAVFHGVLNPGKEGGPGTFEAGTYEFLYKEGPTCAAGSKVPASPAISLGGGMEAVTQTATGLKASTKYSVCLLARGGIHGEETVGPATIFTTATPPEAPTTKSPAEMVTTATATLEGSLNPGGAPTTKAGWYFAYSNGATCTGAGEVQTAHEPELQGTAVPVTPTEIAGLEPNKEYKFCLVATSSVGEIAVGNTVSLKTAPLPPVIASQAASAVNSTSATLEASINPQNQTTSDLFEYATSEATVLAGTGTKVAGPALTGYPEQLGTVALTGLKAGETYYYRVVAQNKKSEEEVKPVDGPPQHFTTVPTPTTEPVTAITATTATFNGHLTPLNEKVTTQYHFDYKLGATECTGEGEISGVEPGLGKGTEAKAIANATGLQPNHEYTVCLITSNESGSDESTVLVHFTTGALPPAIDSESISAVTPSEATLEAQVNPNNLETTYSFQYATNEALTGATKVAGTTLTGFGDQLASVPLTGLTAGDTYYYRVVVENTKTTETFKGAIQSFTPEGPPLTAFPVTVGTVDGHGATLSGSVNPAGLSTTYLIAYADQTAYEEAVAEHNANPYAFGSSTLSGSVNAAYQPVPFGPIELSELTPGTVYHYAVVARNSAGETVGPDHTFTTTAPDPPVATTGTITGLSEVSATIEGTVDTRGMPTTAQFELLEPGGIKPREVLANPESAAGSVEQYTALLNGSLQAGATYQYRISAENRDGITYGEWRSFTTPAFPVIAQLPPASYAGLSLPPFTFPVEKPTTTVVSKPTRAQNLAKALKVCKKEAKKRQAGCKRTAEKKYGPVKTKKRK